MARASFQAVQEPIAPTGSRQDFEMPETNSQEMVAQQSALASSKPSAKSLFILAARRSDLSDFGTMSQQEQAEISSSQTEDINLAPQLEAQVESFVRKPTNLPNHQQVFRPLQRWEGVVVSVNTHGFDAVLKDLTDSARPKERAEFSLDEIEPEDRNLISEGAVFYWVIGYEVTPFLQRKHAGFIRFRRLPAWTESEIESVKREADEMEQILGLRSSTETSPSS